MSCQNSIISCKEPTSPIERISTDKVVCPNCGKEHPYSHKIISMLHAANEIDDGNVPGVETIKTSVISEWEDVTERQ